MAGDYMEIKITTHVSLTSTKPMVDVTKDWGHHNGAFSDLSREYVPDGIIIRANVPSDDLPRPALENLADRFIDKLGFEPENVELIENED